MLQFLVSILSSMLHLLREQPPVPAPSSFDDPVAESTAWTPCVSGGANFCTHKLVNIDHYRVEFRMTAGAWLFGSLFVAMGAAHLSDIHALQIIPEYCRGDKSSYYSYELNLVLRNGERLNVVDHGKKSTLRKDAETLGRFRARRSGTERRGASAGSTPTSRPNQLRCSSVAPRGS